MYELNLENSFDSAKLRVRRTDRLSEIVEAAEKELRKRFNKAQVVDRDIISRAISNFSAIYFSVDDNMRKLGVFSAEGREEARLSKIYSLHKAAVAISNKLRDSSIESILESQETQLYFEGISVSDYDGMTDQTLLGRLLSKVGKIPRSRTSQHDKYNLYMFFDTIRRYARQVLEADTSLETLEKVNQISLILNDFDFKDYSAIKGKKNGDRKNGDNKATSENLEKLPDELPVYSMVYPEARVEDVVGNTVALKKLLVSINQATDYDPVSGENPHAVR